MALSAALLERNALSPEQIVSAIFTATPDLNADFLLHFPCDALFERLARFDEAGKRAVHAGGKVRAASEQQLTPALHHRHDCRGDARIHRELACRAHPYPLVGLGRRPSAAAAAELVRAVPVEQLDGAAGQRQVRIVEHREQSSQPLPAHAGRCIGFTRQLAGPAIDPRQAAQIERSEGLGPQPIGGSVGFLQWHTGPTRPCPHPRVVWRLAAGWTDLDQQLLAAEHEPAARARRGVRGQLGELVGTGEREFRHDVVIADAAQFTNRAAESAAGGELRRV